MIKLDPSAPQHLTPTEQLQYSQVTTRANWAHIASLFFYCVLIALFSVNQWLRAEGISLLQWGVQCGPLFLFWFGLRKRHRRTYLWLCFVLLLYFIKGVEGVMTPGVDSFDWILLIASTALFITSMMTARWQYVREKILFDHDTVTNQGTNK